MLHIWAPEDVRVACDVALRDRTFWREPTGAFGKWYFNYFEPRGNVAIPRSVKCDIQTCKTLVKCSIQWCRMRLESEFCWRALCDACRIGKGCVGGKYELVTNGKFMVRDKAGCPDRVAGRVTVPLGVLFRWIPDIIDLIGWVISVDVDGRAIDRSVNFVGRIFHFPEPGY